MDKATSNEERQEVIKARKLAMFGKENPTYDEMRHAVEQMCQDTLDVYDQKIRSRWVWGSKKRLLIVTRHLLSIESQNFKHIMDIWEDVDRLNRTTVLLGDTIKKTEKITKELDEALSKLKTSLAEPRIAKVAEIMEKIDSDLQERNKAVRDYSV